MLKIFVFGAGVQGTLYAVRLARAGHDVTLVARRGRAAELLHYGAAIKESLTGHTDTLRLRVIERLDPQTVCDICLITVRREHLTSVLSDLSSASGIGQFVFMVNHANGSEEIYQALDRSRVVLAFPGAAGSLEKGVVHYVNVREQRTAVEARALNIAALFRQAGVRVQRVQDMDGWLKQHAAFITAIAGALYAEHGHSRRLAANRKVIRTLITAVREGWSALDQKGVASAPFALRAIFCWVPLWFAVG